MGPLRTVTGEAPRPVGVTLLSIFFALATAILWSTGPSLIWPGTPLDAIWLLNPPRRLELAPYAPWIGPAFIGIGVCTIVLAVGFWRCRPWAWWLAIVMFSAHMITDVGQLAAGRILEGLIGVAAVGLILFYLLRPRVRATFA